MNMPSGASSRRLANRWIGNHLSATKFSRNGGLFMARLRLSPSIRREEFWLDHAAFGPDRSKSMNVIDSKNLERDLREKPLSDPALGAGGRRSEKLEVLK